MLVKHIVTIETNKCMRVHISAIYSYLKEHPFGHTWRVGFYSDSGRFCPFTREFGLDSIDLVLQLDKCNTFSSIYDIEITPWKSYI